MGSRNVNDFLDAISQINVNKTWEKLLNQGRDPTVEDFNKRWTPVFGNRGVWKRRPKYDKGREQGMRCIYNLFFGD